MLAIIGPDWLAADNEGKRRLDDPDDWVRREIVIALGLGRVQVIPVLVGDAGLPAADELPEPLRPLPGRQAITVRPDRFDDDVDNLIEQIGGWRRRWHGFPLWAWIGAGALLVTALVVAFVVRSNQPPVVTPEQITAIGGVPLEIDLLDWVDDESSELAVTADNESTHAGSIADLGGGLITYTGPPRYRGPDSFGFTVRDEQGALSQATANIVVTLGPIGGDFNLAVAEFASTGQSASSVSDALHRQIDEALAEETDVNVEVAGPGEVGPLPGDTPERRAEAAAELASRVAADVVVYGTLDTADGPPLLSAEFFVSDRGLTGAKELAGAYALDTQTLPSSDPGTLSIAASAPRAEDHGADRARGRAQLLPAGRVRQGRGALRPGLDRLAGVEGRQQQQGGGVQPVGECQWAPGRPRRRRGLLPASPGAGSRVCPRSFRDRRSGVPEVEGRGLHGR